jgi:hypothetical protein
MALLAVAVRYTRMVFCVKALFDCHSLITNLRRYSYGAISSVLVYRERDSQVASQATKSLFLMTFHLVELC